MKKFNVIQFDFNSKKVEHYDVLPYFREEWNGKYKKEEKEAIKHYENPAKRKVLLKVWIKSTAQYRFWAKCEYEHLVAPWPFGSYRIKEDLKKFLTPEFDIENIDHSIKFYNILMQDMKKIDVYDQIIMNIDIITDILAKEFNLD